MLCCAVLVLCLQSVLHEGYDRLAALSKDAAKYRALLTDLLVQVGMPREGGTQVEGRWLMGPEFLPYYQLCMDSRTSIISHGGTGAGWSCSFPRPSFLVRYRPAGAVCAAVNIFKQVCGEHGNLCCTQGFMGWCWIAHKVLRKHYQALTDAVSALLHLPTTVAG